MSFCWAAGWYQYQDEPTGYTKRILKTLLDGQYLHAVRDEYTRQRLLKLGITNVLNTACPTMWGLTDDKCAQDSDAQGGARRDNADGLP